MRTRYTLKNLDCATCAEKVENHLKSIIPFQDASVNFSASVLNVSSKNISLLRNAIAEIEPEIEISEERDHPAYDKIVITDIIQSHFRELLFILLSSIMLVFLIINEKQLHATNAVFIEYALAVTAFLLCGYSVLRDAAKTILRRVWFDEKVLMSIASIGAFSIHALEEAIGVMIFYQIGELLQNIAVRQSRNSIQKLIAIRPDFANVKSAGGLIKVSPQEVHIDDCIVVKPGEKIPLDSIVIDGNSTVDASVLTGESLPIEKAVSDTVLAGEINLSGILTLRVTKLFDESSVSKILKLVENASERKARSENFVTTFARYYTPVIVAISALIAILPPLFISGETFTTWIYRALVLLVISCPCALVISIPLGYFGGIGGASRRGILIKGSSFIDALAKVKHVVFDKTGTLTTGTFEIKKVVLQNGFTEEYMLAMAAHAESNSNHPIAKSIVQFYCNKYGHLDSLAVSEHTEISGGGVSTTFNGHRILAGNQYLMKKEGIAFTPADSKESVLYVSIDNTFAGAIIIGDKIKDDAHNAMRLLHHAGIHDITMLTGDNTDAAQAVADRLSIKTVYAELLPENKVTILEKICRNKTQHGTVAFAGDGINDAPVIARADVGIAMGAFGADAAIETADVVLMTDHPSKVAEAVLIGRATRAIVIQNIFLSLGVKFVILFLGISGFVSMWGAVFADVGVALLAILNASRIRRYTPDSASQN